MNFIKQLNSTRLMTVISSFFIRSGTIKIRKSKRYSVYNGSISDKWNLQTTSHIHRLFNATIVNAIVPNPLQQNYFNQCRMSQLDCFYQSASKFKFWNKKLPQMTQCPFPASAYGTGIPTQCLKTKIMMIYTDGKNDIM